MGKGKKPTSALGKGSKGRKNHGPKTHIHHDIYPKALRHSIALSGVLRKEYDYESWTKAVMARGAKITTYEEFYKFVNLPDHKKVEYFSSIRRK